MRVRGHRECALDLDVVCHLGRQAGWSVAVEPLAEYLGLRVTEPVASTPLAGLLADHLGHAISPTLFWTRQELTRRLGRRPVEAIDAFFERGELVRLLSSFRAIRLEKCRVLRDSDFDGDLVLRPERGTAKVPSADGRTEALVMAHPPFRPCRLNGAAAFLWDCLDGRRSLEDLAGRLARRYRLDRVRARGDVRAWARDLHRRRYVS